MWFCLGIRRGVGRASTSRVQRLRSAWTWGLAISGSTAGPACDDGSVCCRRDGAPFGDAPVVSRDNRRGAVRALSASSDCHEGFIGPLSGLSLLIDTGTIPSMVDVRIARKLHLQVEPSMLVAFGQSVAMQSTVVSGFRIGALQTGPVPAGVSDLSYFEGLRVDAIVGLDVLARTSFGIDYRKRVLRFSPTAREESVAPLELAWPFLTTQITIAGQQVRLLVDTGSSDLVLFKSRMPAGLSGAPWSGDKTVQVNMRPARPAYSGSHPTAGPPRERASGTGRPASGARSVAGPIPAEHRWRAGCAGPRLPASAVRLRATRTRVEPVNPWRKNPVAEARLAPRPNRDRHPSTIKPSWHGWDQPSSHRADPNPHDAA